MTARHVLIDGKGRPCTAKVVQDGTGRSFGWCGGWRFELLVEGPTDLALAVLASPLTGYRFSISSASPKSGQLVIALGYGSGSRSA